MASSWKPVVICPNRRLIPELAPLLSQCLPMASPRDLAEYPARQDVADKVGGGQFNLCLLDATSDKDRALTLIAEIQQAQPGLSIVSLLSTNDPDFLLSCLRQGASEFLTQPFTAEQLQPALDRIARLTGISTTSGKVVCVMPAKGACGATTVATSLAYHCKRLGAKRALLADLDPLTGTISFLLKVKSQYSFLDVLTRHGQMDSDIWKGLIAQSSGFDVLLSPENPVHGLGDVQDSAVVVDYVRTAYDISVLDTNGAYGMWGLSMARQCDELVLVTTNEVPALQAAHRTLSYLDLNRIPREKIRLVVNRFHKDAGLAEDLIPSAIGMDVSDLLPSDYDTVQKFLLEGKPVPGTTPFGRGVASIAEKLLGPMKAEKPEAAKKKESGGFLGKLFGR